MAGIYIHIPFCRQKCSYCNFYFSVSMKTKNALVEAILKEIELNHNYLSNKKIDSIYFGGGTPSVLSSVEIALIIERLNQYFIFNSNIEITLEANPDDINKKYLNELKNIGINRFSMGVQSFFDDELIILNRSHNATKAQDSIKMIQDAGFDNMNIDLIFGIPNSNIERWQQNLKIFLELDIPHLSSYNLTIEPKTTIAHQIKIGKYNTPDDELNAELFLITQDILQSKGYEHYEISNYAKNRAYALHNTNYWKGIPYLGFGPSAHSYDGESRQWNIANNRKYIKILERGNLPFEKEILSTEDKYNEYIMTGFRTMWGVDIKIISNFGQKFKENFELEIIKYIENRFVKKENNIYKLSKKGKLYADKIASDLFMED